MVGTWLGQISVLTTARLIYAGLWESNERYLFVCVTLRYTLTSTRPSGRTVVLVSRKAIVGLPVDVDGISKVN